MASQGFGFSPAEEGIEDVSSSVHAQENNYVLTLEEITNLAHEGGSRPRP